jgi:hypothetical protein
MLQRLFQVFQMFQGYVASVSYGVAKVDRDVVYVVMVVHVYCKLLFLMFHLFFQMYVTSVFIWTLHISRICLQVFYLDVAYVLLWFQVFFRCLTDVRCKCCI